MNTLLQWLLAILMGMTAYEWQLARTTSPPTTQGKPAPVEPSEGGSGLPPPCCG